MDLNNVFIYRMVHVANIPHIIEFGITHKDSPNSNENYTSMGDSTLINRRNGYELPNGKLIGQYIPFYFGLRTPMLYVIQKGYNGVDRLSPDKIVYLRVPIQQIVQNSIPFVYTDGHSIDAFTSFYSPSDVNNLSDQVDFNAARSKYWKDENDLDLKRRKEAEFLILNDIPYSFIHGFAVYNESCKSDLIGLGINENKIAIEPQLYF